MADPRDFFDRCIKACYDLETRLREIRAEFEPVGWLVITQQQRIWLLQGVPNYMNPETLIGRPGALGYLVSMPIHIAKPDDKVEDWLYGRFVVDMRKETL